MKYICYIMAALMVILHIAQFTVLSDQFDPVTRQLTGIESILWIIAGRLFNE